MSRRVTGLLVVLAALFAVALFQLAEAGRARRPVVRVFHAAGLAPFVRVVRDDAERTLHAELQCEASGSVEACRKLASLGRTCDLLILADNQLVRQQVREQCAWRIDFATDEVVLGVGVRAPLVAEAERSWPGVLLREEVRLARADETLSPIGYRTLLVLKLQEREGGPSNLCERFLARQPIKVDDIERLVPLLRSGEADYAFLHRSACVAHGIRFITLDRGINLGAADADYSGVTVEITRQQDGRAEQIRRAGSPAVWTLAQPGKVTPRQVVDACTVYLLQQKAALAGTGLQPLARARFYGSPAVYRRFEAVAEFAGDEP
jgi:molybdate/tungstate transport system substrate-binding protein